MNRPAWLIDIPSEEYHAATKRGEYLTSHQLAVFRRCPAEYRKRLDGEIIDKDTSTFALGRATHSWVLEGKAAFDLEFVVSDGPINPKTGKPFGRMTKEFAKWREGVESGAFTVDGVPVAEDMKVKKNIVSVEEFALIEAMRKAVGMHPVAWELVSEGFAEGTVRTEWDGEPVQCRMDWFNPESGDIVDLKTCSDVDKFRWDIRDFGYAYQLSFYERLVRLAGYEKPVRCWLVAVEKKEPYRVCVVKISEATIENCNEMSMASETLNEANGPMIRDLKACRASGVWPTRYENVVII